MREKIQVGALKIGMFVSDLDRPWLDTPFLLQGFLVETDEEIAKLKYHCQYVIVDRLRSVGDEFKSDEAAKPRQSVNAGGASSLRGYDDNAGKRAPQPSSILGTLKTIMRETFASRPKPGGRRREHPGSHHSDGESTAAARARGAGVRARYYA